MTRGCIDEFNTSTTTNLHNEQQRFLSRQCEQYTAIAYSLISNDHYYTLITDAQRRFRSLMIEVEQPVLLKGWQ